MEAVTVLGESGIVGLLIIALIVLALIYLIRRF